jgi:carboxyl-terminal processing protease
MQRSITGIVLGALCVSILAAPAVAYDSVDVSELISAAEALDVGEEQEDAHRYGEAIQLYEAALKRWKDPEIKEDKNQQPPVRDLIYALRRTRVQFGIARRYTDASFDKRMLTQGRSEALNLLEEVLARVQLEYVKKVSATRFIAHGTESFYMALSNHRFVEQHLKSADSDDIERVKGTLIRDYWNRRVGSRLEARSVVTEVCELAHKELGLRSSIVVMEYIFGGCNALDVYSHLLTPDRYSDLTGSIQGEFVGIGIEMVSEAGQGMKLVRVLMESPAEEGGLNAGDHIVKIDGRDCLDYSTDEAAQLLRGLSGSKVKLGFEDPDGRYHENEFRRRAVHVRSITRALIVDEDRGIGYIKQNGFQSSTTQELDDALAKLEARGMKSLIWDLRGNPGGLLDTAAKVLDRFIDTGVLVTTKGRSYDQNQTFQARNWKTRDYPLVLLVDEDSASASEIVAGAIHDYGRGKIVGRKTYGKWSVQSIIHMPGGTGLKLTTAKFYSPDDKNYAGIGLKPDVEVEAHETLLRGHRPVEVLRDIRRDPDVFQALVELEDLQDRYTQKTRR